MLCISERILSPQWIEMQRALPLRNHVICHGKVPGAAHNSFLAYNVPEVEFLLRSQENLINAPEEVSVENMFQVSSRDVKNTFLPISS